MMRRRGLNLWRTGYQKHIAPPKQGVCVGIQSRHLYTYINTCGAVHYTEYFVQSVHQWTSLPWWAVIGGLTVTLRSLVTLPLAVHQNKVVTRMELLQPTLKEFSEAIKHNVVIRCRREGLPVEEANRRYRTEVRKMAKQVYLREGCHPLKVALLPWIQLPLWIILSLALRNMSGAFPGSEPSVAILTSLSTEGVLWFSDLTVPDPYYILPLTLSASNLLNIEMHALKRKDPGRLQRSMTNFFRFLSLGIGIIATQLPSAMTLYWSTSSLYSLVQNSLFMLPRVRRILGIPQTPSESKTPYRDLLMKLNEKGEAFLNRQRQTK